MPLKIASLSQSERQFLADNLLTTDDPTPLAARLLDRMVRDPQLISQATIEVNRLLSSRRNALAQQEVEKQRRYYQFGTQHHSPSPEHATFSQYKVHDYDFAKFCKHFGVSEFSLKRTASSLNSRL